MTDGEELDSVNSNVVHIEIPTDDLARAKKFYSELFGWNLQDAPGYPDYPMVAANGSGPGIALMRRQGATNTLVDYFGVESVDACVEKVQKLGGVVVTPKMAVAGMGWFAQFLDTEGNLFAVFQNDTSAK